jgi:hypothetical protein
MSDYSGVGVAAVSGFATLAFLAFYSDTLMSLTNISETVRIGLVVYITISLLLPVVVYIDMWRHMDQPNGDWVLASLLPLINLFSVISYLEARDRLFRSEE